MRPARVVWLLFAAFVVYGTTLPFACTLDRAVIRHNASRIRLNPLLSPETGRRESIPDATQNVALFVPFGILGIVALGRTRRAIAMTALLAAGLSVLVELLQLFTTDRISSFGDVAFNTCGALAGALAAVWLASGREPQLRTLSNRLSASPDLSRLIFATALVTIFNWEPFDVTLDVSVTVHKIRLLQQDWWQYTGVRDEGVAALLFGFFGFVVAAWLFHWQGGRSATRWTAAGSAAATGVVSAFALEGAQLIIASRMPGLEDAVVRACASGLGALVWAGAAGRVRPRFAVGLLLAALAASVAPLVWRETAADYHDVMGFLNGLLLIAPAYALAGYACIQLLPRGRQAIAGAAAALATAVLVEIARGRGFADLASLAHLACAAVGLACGLGWAIGMAPAPARQSVSIAR